METPVQSAISLAKTEYREGFNTGDVERVLSVYAPEFTDFSEDTPSFYGDEAAKAMRLRLREMFSNYRAEMAVIIIDIAEAGDSAVDFGWHKLTLTPKSGGEAQKIKYRYYETWKRQPDGSWKIDFVITNRELPPKMLPGNGA